MSRTGNVRRQVTLTEEEAATVSELSARLGVDSRTAFRRILEAGFKYWSPERFGDLKGRREAGQGQSGDFREAVEGAIDGSSLASVSEERFDAICFLLMILICEDRSPDTKRFAGITPADNIRAFARTFAHRLRVGGKGFGETLREMEADGYRMPLFDDIANGSYIETIGDAGGLR